MGIELRAAYMGQPAAANTLLYTCPANTTARILKCTVTDDTDSAKYISFHLVPSGGTVGPTNMIMNAQVIGGDETYECPEIVGHGLEAGDFLSAIAETADQLTVALTVVEIT